VVVPFFINDMTAVAAWHLHARVGGSNGVPVAHCLLCKNGRKTLQQLCKDQIATQSVTFATMEPIISWFRVQDKQDVACARRIHGCTAQSAWFHFTCTQAKVSYSHLRQTTVHCLESTVEKYLEYVEVFDHCVQSQNWTFMNGGNVIIGTAL